MTGHGRRRPCATGSAPRMPAGPGLAPHRDDVLRVPDPGCGQPWAHVDLEPRSPPWPARPRPLRSPPMRGLPAGADRPLRKQAVLDAAPSTARQAAQRGDRAAWEAAYGRGRGDVGRTGRPSRTHRRGRSGAMLPRRRDRHHRCRQLRPLGRARLPLPPAGHLPRARPRARWATRCRPRSPRRWSTAIGRRSRSSATAASAMTMAELETAVRERARVDRRSSSTTSATARSGRTRSGAAAARASRRSSGRSTSPPWPGRVGREVSVVERDAEFEPALRAGARAPGPDGDPARARSGMDLGG